MGKCDGEVGTVSRRPREPRIPSILLHLGFRVQDRLNIDDADFFFPMGGGGQVVAAPAADDEGAAPAQEAPKAEKTVFNVNLKSFDAKNKIKVR